MHLVAAAPKSPKARVGVLDADAAEGSGAPGGGPKPARMSRSGGEILGFARIRDGEPDEVIDGVEMAALALGDDSSDLLAQPLPWGWCCQNFKALCHCNGRPKCGLRCLACCADLLQWNYGAYAPNAPPFNRKGWEANSKDPKGPGRNERLKVTCSDIELPGCHGRKTIACRVFEPDAASPQSAIILFFHAGGFCINRASDAFYRPVFDRLASATGMTLVAVDYALAPENPFPASWEDAYDTMVWVALVQKGVIKGDPKRLVVMGDSAGASLSLLLSGLVRDRLTIDLTPQSEEGIVIVHQVLMYPILFWSAFLRRKNIFDQGRPRPREENLFLPQSSRNFFATATFGSLGRIKELERSDRRMAPLLVTAERLPRTTVISAELDSLKHENKFLVHVLKKAGVQVKFQEFTNVTHGFVSMGLVCNDADRAIDVIIDELSWLKEPGPG